MMENQFIICSGLQMLTHYMLSYQAEPRQVEILGQLLYAAKIVAEKEGIVDGFRVVINNGSYACKLSSLNNLDLLFFLFYFSPLMFC